MKVLKVLGVLVAILVVIVIVLIIAAPKTYDMHREITIKAPASVVWKGISTFEEFNKWNPFNKMDSNQVVMEEGTDGQVGAKHSWKGKKTGEGSMTITRLDPEKAVDYDLAFKGNEGMQSTGYMTMEKAGEGYKVVWGFKGNLTVPHNVMGLFMDKMMGGTFESGLADLKKLCESTPAAPSYTVSETDWTEKNCLGVKKTISFKEVGPFYGENFPKISMAITKAGAKPGIPLGVYYTWDEMTMMTDMAAAIPYDAKKNFGKEFTDIKLPASKAYKIDYYGWYDKMKPAYDVLTAKIKSMGMEHPDLAIEEYVNDPMTEKDTAKLHTVIYFLVNKPVAAK